MNLNEKHIVITGVSKGIGLSLSKLLIDKSCHVYGWGRTDPGIKSDYFHFISCDVRDENSVQSAAEKSLAMSNDSIDGLINNAGLGYFGYLEEMPMDEIKVMMDTNVYGVFNVTRSLLPCFKENKSGHIINISSIAGIEAYPQVSVYSASKFAITGFSEALYKELRDFGIKVTCVHPGSTQTNFFDNVESIKAHDQMLSPVEVANNLVFLLESSDNFLTNTIVFRPLQPKPKS